MRQYTVSVQLKLVVVSKLHEYLYILFDYWVMPVVYVLSLYCVYFVPAKESLVIF